MSTSIYLPFVSTKPSIFPNGTSFPAKQRITKTSSSSTTCISAKAAVSNASHVVNNSSLQSVALSPTDREVDTASVTLHAMQRANVFLEDFCRSYFMFHEMDVNSAESLFKYLPVLLFTESFIYQLDNMNEQIMLGTPGLEPSDVVFREFADCLEGLGIYTDRIRNELNGGEEFWALERKLCDALKRKEKIRVEDVMRACYLRSTDYRITNLILYELNGKQVNETHMEFISATLFIVELFEDFYHYEDDVLNNSYNTIRMFVGLYGASAATMLEKLVMEATEKYNYLLSTLDPKLALEYKKRREDATKERYKWIKLGRKELDSPFGTLYMPPIIEDEDLYRYEISNTMKQASTN